MIKLENILNDFETIAKEIQSNNGKVVENDFIARLVICYTEADKSKKASEYAILQGIIEKLNTLQIDYKCKENKYFYLLKKTDFENLDDFKKLQSLFNGGIKTSSLPEKQGLSEYKILTINLNNLQNYKKFIDLSINLLKNK